MSEEGPKLYVTKPKKSKLKQSTTPTAHVKVASIGTAPPPPPAAAAPQPVKESFARRYKFLWPLLLAVNFTVGAYLFTRTKKKDNVGPEETEPPKVSASPTSTAAVAGATITATSITPPVAPSMPRAPIPADQQREIFKWILAEKRKVRPRNAEEKKHIDEEKAILKQFIRAKSVPSL